MWIKDVNKIVVKIKNNEIERNKFIMENKIFVIKTISNKLGRYIRIENDDEFSIGLIAFNEAIERYEKGRGNFYSFARLVIESRIVNFEKKENKHSEEVSIEMLQDNKIGIEEKRVFSEELDLKLEIIRLEEELRKFGFEFEDLIDIGPKHIDTKRRGIAISEKIGEDEDIMTKMYEILKLPIQDIVRKYKYTEKILRGSKYLIITTSIIVYKNFKELKNWIMGGDYDA